MELSDLIEMAPCSIPRSEPSENVGEMGFLVLSITLVLISPSGDMEVSLPPISILMFGKVDLEMPVRGD